VQIRDVPLNPWRYSHHLRKQVLHPHQVDQPPLEQERVGVVDYQYQYQCHTINRSLQEFRLTHDLDQALIVVEPTA
jgi:hypothetical protein